MRALREPNKRAFLVGMKYCARIFDGEGWSGYNTIVMIILVRLVKTPHEGL